MDSTKMVKAFKNYVSVSVCSEEDSMPHLLKWESELKALGYVEDLNLSSVTCDQIISYEGGKYHSAPKNFYAMCDIQRFVLPDEYIQALAAVSEQVKESAQ